MADFKTAAQKIYDHLVEKETWLNGSAHKRWMLSDYPSIAEALKAVDYKDADDKAYQVYGELKDPKAKVPPEKEIGLRTQLVFMAALTATVRQQFAAGNDNHSRTALDTYRYEMGNNKAVRCHLSKLIKTLPHLETAGTQK